MKFLISMLILTLSLQVQARTIRDSTCQIGVSKALSHLGFLEWTLRDESLQILVDKGYSPYHVYSPQQVPSGLYLTWSSRITKTLFGKKETYYFTIKNKYRDALVGTSSGGSITSALRGLPSCQ